MRNPSFALDVIYLYIYIAMRNPSFALDVIYTEYYMSKSVSHAVSTQEPYITPRVDIGRGLIWHVMQILTCNVHYIIYFNHAFNNTYI